MGCGSSGNVVASAPPDGNGTVGNGAHHDDLPTVVLPDTPPVPKAPIAYEIPLEEFDGPRKSSPPPHLQRLLQPPAPPSLPDIQDRLAEAEQRRLTILQQRAASAQKRAQKVIRPIETDKIANGHDLGKVSNVVTISPQPGECEDKNI
ncbi:uncharacterized protein LOC121733789 [Aricia agestis]|uniref:uncharacterized protein LOC121733789 n=1 Tax=Aricia agestis TaxID=91739 RepID=UPI001C204643|nr:uncharacterized protein LOC121733789 [Aricia agestis]